MTDLPTMRGVLRELGVDFFAKEHRAYKFKSPGFMDLNVDTWVDENKVLHIAVAHNGIQNGDVMADPDMEFLDIGTTDLYPVHYQNDYVPVFENSVASEAINSRREFARAWASNIRLQEYRLERVR